MKNLIVVLGLFALLLVGASAQNQAVSSPARVWSKQFTFGGTYDIPWNVYSSSDGSIFANGHRQVTVNQTAQLNAGLAKFSESTKVWTVIDDTASEAGNNAIAEVQGDIIWAMDGNILTRRSPSNGSIKWRVVPSPFQLSLLGYGDTIVAVEVTQQSSFRVLFIGPDGVTKRSFSVARKTVANATARILGNSIWICSMTDVDGTACGFIAQYDLQSGRETWVKTTRHAVKAFFELDGAGNSYVGNTVQDLFGLDHDTVGFAHFELSMLDPNGNVAWINKWYGHDTYEANYENWMRTLSFSSAKNAVVVGGSTQKGNTVHTGDKSAWVKIFNATTGDTFWSKTWEYSPSAIASQVNSSTFNASGDLIVLGNTHTGGNTQNFGYLEKYTFDKVTSVRELPATIPSSFSLSQNYPNPFNPMTTVHFSVLTNSFVSIRVYDVTGREVAVLANGTIEHGTYKMRFDGSNLPSGMYFCRMTAGTFTKTVKMLLVK